MEKIILRKYTDLSYLLSNLSSLNYYLECVLDENLDFSKSDICYLNEINQMLEKNKSRIKWKKSICEFKSNLELILLKEKYNDDYFSYACKIYKKDKIDENDILLFSNLFDNKECKFVFQRLILKSCGLFTFDDETIDVIKRYIDDDIRFNKLVNSIGKKRVEEVLDELNISEDRDASTPLILKNRFLELLNILNRASLCTDTIKNIIITTKIYLNKIKQDECYDNNGLYKKIIGILKKIEKSINSNPINNITNKLINDELKLDFGKTYLQPISYDVDKLPFLVKKTPIISLDSIVSPDLDSAFSIRKENDLYFFNIYITDVPSFLSNNRELSINSYRQGTSFYIRDGKKNINYDMLPEKLSHNYLSMLKGNKPKNAICFQFIFNNDGKLENCKVSRNKVVIDFNLFEEDALKILKKKNSFTLVDKSIFMMQELTKKVASNSDKANMRVLRRGDINHMIAFPSVLVNYYLAENLEFGMFYENGAYIKSPSTDTPYLRSSAPLRRYADDINLALFLEQENLQHFNQDDFRYLENNFDEIIGYLNERNIIDKYINNNNSLVKKYYLKRD